MSVEREIDRNIAIVTDDHHSEKANTTCSLLREKGYIVVVFKIRDPIDGNRLEEEFTKRPLGSVVLLFGKESSTLKVERLAISVGFLKEDIYNDTAPKFRMFCSQCHEISTVNQKGIYRCRNCDQKMEPSDHYSAFHRSYLAYPVFNTDFLE